MKTLIAWIRSDLERPLAKRLHGGEGSGKSFVLAAIASRIMQVAFAGQSESEGWS